MSNAAPWLAFFAAIVASALTGLSGFVLHYKERERQRRHEILHERKRALFDALRVIDQVYTHDFTDRQGKTDIELARDAMNRIQIYCCDPAKTWSAFTKAVGLHNPEIEDPPGMRLEYLAQFRKEVARELEIPASQSTDLDRIWIKSLSGADKAGM